MTFNIKPRSILYAFALIVGVIGAAGCEGYSDSSDTASPPSAPSATDGRSSTLGKAMDAGERTRDRVDDYQQQLLDEMEQNQP